jgi:YbbR domain-containing protein
VDAITTHWRNTASFPIDLPKAKTRWQSIAQMSVSLALAIFFWATLIIAQGEMLEKVVTVPVEFTASPPHLVLVGDKDKRVRLHLSGIRSDLDDIHLEELSVKIDLSKTSAGRQTFGITAENLRLPRSVNLVDVVPSSIELTLAEIVEQEIGIEPQLVGKLPGNLKIASLEVIPSRVKVLSPADLGKEKGLRLITTPIYLDSVHKDSSIFCKIVAPPSIQPADKRWPDVEVVIKVVN